MSIPSFIQLVQEITAYRREWKKKHVGPTAPLILPPLQGQKDDDDDKDMRSSRESGIKFPPTDSDMRKL